MELPERIRAGRRRQLGGAAVVTLLVRVISLAGQVMLVAHFGAGAEIDGFLLALLVPSMLSATAGAVLELSVPAAYARVRGDAGNAAAFRYRLLRDVAAVAAVVTVCLVVARGPVVRGTGFGATDDQVRFAMLAATWVFVTVGCRIVSGGLTALLVGARRVHLPIIARLGSPVALIAVLLASDDADVRTIAIASAVGDIVEAVLLAAMLFRTDGFVRRRAAPGYGDVAQAVRDLSLSQALVNLGPAADQMFVATLAPGRLVIFSLASRLFEVAKAVFSMPAARLAHADIAVHAAATPQFDAAVRRELRRAWKVGLGAGLALAAGAPVVLYTIFRRGEFEAADARTASLVALVFAVGIVVVTVSWVLGRVLVTQGQARGASRLTLLFVGLNIVFDAVLVEVFDVYGVAAATGLAYGSLAVLQWRMIRRASSPGAAVAQA